MSRAPIAIKRYPNRRYYARHTSKYVSLQEIEALIQAGETVEIRDSQTGEDLTRAVLTQIIVERQPEKMRLFPTDMLHFILRSNDMMSDFLRDYFSHSLTYLNYLQRHSAAATAMAGPMHWVKAWMDGIAAQRAVGGGKSEGSDAMPPIAAGELAPAPPPDTEAGLVDRAAQLAERVEQLEARLRQLEARAT